MKILKVKCPDQVGIISKISTVLFKNYKFAQRIKSLKDQRLYSFENPSVHKKKEQSIIPHRKIKESLIINNFDEILRIAATIGTKHTETSQIFKRINSYSN